MIAYPLGLFDCCGVSDGAAAAIVTTPEIARSLKKAEPVLVKALAISVSSGEESLFNNWDGAHLETTYRAGQMAFKEAGIKNPREEISMMEVHDCFSITELTVYEDLQISPRGRAIEDIYEWLLRPRGESSLPAGRRAQMLRPSHRSFRIANALRDVQPAPGEVAGGEEGEEPPPRPDP